MPQSIKVRKMYYLCRRIPITDEIMVEEYIVLTRSNQKAKNGSNFATIKISRQKSEAYTFSIWDVNEGEGPDMGDIIKADVKYLATVKFPRKADFSNFRDCHPATPSDSLYAIIPRPIEKDLWDSCISKLLDLCSDQLLIDFIRKESDALYASYKTQTAATGMHHAFKGGLLNHTYELLNMLIGLYPTLPPIKLERCIIAVLFHDYGKLKEYDDAMEPTKYMYLLGHIYISAHVLHNKLNEFGVPNEETIRIIHCVLAHHGKREFGSPVVPCNQEALVVHYVDDISAHTSACDETANMEKNFALETRVVKG
jgi:23S rRNA maturation-related 3'-5' exoribonuclease YhaM